jgi:ubiquinone/menaquinone biosynthesis C-methylase UbiE
VDIQQEMLDMLQRRAHAAKAENIVSVLGGETDPHLPENALDLVFMVDVYHEFSQPEAMLKSIRKSLKPDGRIALVEFRSEDPNVPIKPEHKMSKQQILKEFPANGFKLVGQFDGLPWQHLMFFSRSAEKRSAEKSSTEKGGTEKSSTEKGGTGKNGEK